MTKSAYDKTKYNFKWRATYYKCKAEQAAKVFAQIEKENGNITPQLIVDHARPEKSPLHDDFTWQNKTAAERWRKHEARMMIASLVRVRIKDSKEDGREHRAFVSIKQKDEDKGYLNIDSAMEDQELSPKILNGALNRAQYWLDEYWAFREIDEMKKPYKYIEAAVINLQDVIARKAETSIANM